MIVGLWMLEIPKWGNAPEEYLELGASQHSLATYSTAPTSFPNWRTSSTGSSSNGSSSRGWMWVCERMPKPLSRHLSDHFRVHHYGIVHLVVPPRWLGLVEDRSPWWNNIRMIHDEFKVVWKVSTVFFYFCPNLWSGAIHVAARVGFSFRRMNFWLW